MSETMKKRTLRQDFHTLRRALAAAHRLEPRLIPVCVLSSLFSAAQPFVNLYLSARIIDELLNGRRLPALLVLVLWTVGLNLALHLLTQGLERLYPLVQTATGKREEFEIEKALFAMDFGNLEDPEYQRIYQKYYEIRRQQGNVFSYVLTDTLFHVSKGLFLLLFSIALAFPVFVTAGLWSSSVLSLLLLAAVVLSALLICRLNRRDADEFYQFLEESLGSNREYFHLLNLFENYRTGQEIRLFQEQNVLISFFDRCIRDNLPPMMRYMRVSQKCRGLSAVVSVLLSGLTYLFVGLRALAGVFSVGSVVRYAGAISQFTAGLIGLTSAVTELRKRSRFYEYYFAVLDAKPTEHRGTLPVEKRDDNDYEITFRHVSFRYPGSSEWALRDLNLSLRIGKKLAVVGRNGSGKTTMIKLLCRLYDPTEGEILLNGIDIRKYDYQEYLGLFSVVFQDFQLFSFPLDQNVAASADPDGTRVRRCLEEIGFGERLRELPRGMSTYLYRNFEESGVEISGGEAQKIALARALFKDAPFLILDEPTAALDPVSEYEVYLNFDKIVGEKTAVYISHRLSSCRFCEDIAVFHRGRLVQRGGHDQLLGEDGLYRRLWNAQAQYYVDAGG